MKQKIIRYGLLFIALASIIILLMPLTGLDRALLQTSLPNPWDSLSILYGLVVFATGILLIQEHNRPTKTLAWLLVIFFIPVLGLILYLFFGLNYRKRRRFGDYPAATPDSPANGLDQFPPSFSAAPYDQQLCQSIHRLLHQNSGATLWGNNQLEILGSGQEKQSVLLADLEQAKDYIHLSYYIFENGRWGEQIGQCLKQKAEQGLDVRLLFDDVGSWNLGNHFLKDLQLAGVKIAPFLPVRFPLLTSRFNYRNHRKIVVIDGRVGYTGGINIDDRYLTSEGMFWRDTHLRIQGAAVQGLHQIFLQDWNFSIQGKLSEDAFGYEVKAQHSEGQEANSLVQIVGSGPHSKFPNIMQAYFAAITRAQKEVKIATPYFVPNDTMLTALQTAALSGVHVQLLLPHRSDSKIVHLTARSYLRSLLEAGVEVYEYEKGFLHAKILLVDDSFASIGTANMDIRSFETNFEVNAICYDAKLNTALKKQYHNDLQDSQQLVIADVANKRFDRRLAEGLARLFSPLL